MADAYQLDGPTVRRLFDALAWVERQKQAEVRPRPDHPFPIGTLQRFGYTCANPNTGIYPKPADRPNTYWFKFYRETHALTQGRQLRTEAWLDDFPPPLSTDPDGYWIAHCYTDTSPATKTYVPEGSLILVSWHNQRWWFHYQREELWGRVTKAESLATGQWKYTFSEVYKGTEAYGGWVDVPSGRSGYLYNSVEEVGDATAVQIPIGAVVEVHTEYWDNAGTVATEYWCQYEEFDQTDASSSGGYTTIDVHVCGAWNRCGSYIVIPQRRIYLPPGTRIDTLANDVIPIYLCESSGGDGSDYFEPSTGGGEDWYLWWDDQSERWVVSGLPGVLGTHYWISTAGPLEDPDDQNPYNPGGLAAGTGTMTDVGPFGFAFGGTLVPDVTGNYTFVAMLNGKPYYRLTIIILP